MKKVIYFAAIAVFTTVTIYSCTKEKITKTASKAESSSNDEGEPSGSNVEYNGNNINEVFDASKDFDTSFADELLTFKKDLMLIDADGNSVNLVLTSNDEAYLSERFNNFGYDLKVLTTCEENSNIDAVSNFSAEKIDLVEKGILRELKIIVKSTNLKGNVMGFNLAKSTSSSPSNTSAATPGYGSAGAYQYSDLDSYITLANGITVNYVGPVHLAPYYNWERIGVRFANKKYSIYVNWTYEAGFYEIGIGTGHNSVKYCIKNYNRIKAATYRNENGGYASVSFWGSSSCANKIYF